ncbi:DNA topoisomerase (ATP-hydrolyzing) [Spirulina sp. 06S082]|uniref:DNA gyrase/topoisomerase IV subunit A n=1 Tax=Spirulina sp. 06S082 TaxID=3110248 RepID=UPI002B1FAD28|nr:DNA topoisomerase (ATP-hydrolyzing) [Spirulina sp. 06S082]MEA5471550.1 DNA topoisomerase (ATP-hydrolyzing) [Spirulina sp. 06S082]
MAKQLNLLETGQIIPTALHTEMERSYLEYAMSVIVGRALPDVRDGLKPVHRRILYAMHELGLTPDRPYRKCARVVGDVLGKYHPHGDQSVYDALVRMVQEFSSRYPLLAGHGNFGSVDNDPPAAMRYTETRLAAIAHEAMLGNIGEATVDYGNNFDNSQQEPVVLPAQLPLLLLNGCTGIAVGMATNVPPHNLRELVDGLIALIDKPDLPDEKLWKLIPGPDFPTGGEIVGTKGVREAYQTGRGIMTMRGVARIEKVQGGSKRRREKAAIVVTELPYQVNKAGWIEKVADLVNQGRMEGISDIRDESDRDGMRVVIETKRDANPREVLRQLYKQSALQSNFGAILLTLVDNKPCQLSLRAVLEEFLKFREETLTRLYTYDLEESQRRQHLIEGLLAALNNLDLTIDILRHAPDGTTAKVSLQERLDISASQADSILAMPMRRLTGLERQKLETEAQELQEKIAGLELLLRDRAEFLKSLKKDLRTLKRKFGDDRRTRIVTEEAVKGGEKKKEKGKKKEEKTPTLSTENLFTIPDDAVLEVTRKGGICWQSPPSKPKAAKKPEDLLLCREAIAGRKELVVVTDSGKAYPLLLGDIPASGGKAVPLLKFLPSSVKNKREAIFSCFFVPQDLKQNFLVLMTQNGRIKRLAGAEVAELTNRGSLLIKFKEDDCLNYLGWAQEGDEMAIATSAGRVLRLNVDDEQLPVMGRNTLGNQATRVRVKEEIIGGITLPPEQDLLIVTQQGYAKRIPLNLIRKVNRGDIGTQVMQFVDKGDRLVGIMVAPPENQRFVAISQTQRLLYVPVKSVKVWGKDGVGDRIFQLKDNETIVEIARR